MLRRVRQAGRRNVATACELHLASFPCPAWPKTARWNPEGIHQGRHPKAFRMEKSSKRGKIPPQDWPSIITRYQSGETLASIARTYDCSPPAISYIVSRSRARNAAAEAQGAGPPQEPQLVKSHPAETSSGGTPLPSTPSAPPIGNPLTEPTGADSRAVSGVAAAMPSVAAISSRRADAAQRSDELRLFADEAPPASILRRDPPPHAEDAAAERQGQRPPPSGNGNSARSFAPAGAPPPNGEPRRTLHLSLSGNDGGHRHDPQPHSSQNSAGGPTAPDAGERVAPQQTGPHPGAGQTARPAMGQYVPAGNGAPLRAAQEPQPARDGGSFIDQALRQRVDGDIAAFLAAFDAALDHDTAESRAGLREATDRLLRAGARTRIELERLEARVPLVPRENSGHEARSFRPR